MSEFRCVHVIFILIYCFFVGDIIKNQDFGLDNWRLVSVKLALELFLVVAAALDLLFSQGYLTDEDLIVFGHLIDLLLQPAYFILLPDIELPALTLLSLLYLLLHSLAILAQQIPFLPDGLILFFGPDHFQLIIVHLR